MAKEKKKRSKFFWFMLLIIIIVALGLAWKFGLLKGLGLGEGKESTTNNLSESIAPEEAIEESQVNDEEKQSIAQIEVQGESYFWNGEKVDLKELEKNISELSKDMKIELIDNKAIQSAYQEVLDTLTNLEIDFDQIKD